MDNFNYSKSLQQAKKTIKENAIIWFPIPVIDIVNNYGLVVEEDNSLNSSSKLLWKEKKIIVNKNQQVPRKRFFIAHDLGHFLMHTKLPEFKNKEFIDRSMPILSEEKKWYEKEADYFAANILVPFDFLKIFIEKKQNDIYLLSEKFNVSPIIINFQIENYNGLSQRNRKKSR